MTNTEKMNKIIREKKSEGREAFVKYMQRRKALIESDGVDVAAATLIEEYENLKGEIKA